MRRASRRPPGSVTTGLVSGMPLPCVKLYALWVDHHHLDLVRARLIEYAHNQRVDKHGLTRAGAPAMSGWGPGKIGDDGVAGDVRPERAAVQLALPGLNASKR